MIIMYVNAEQNCDQDANQKPRGNQKYGMFSSTDL